MYSKISEEQNLRKVTESLYIFLTSPDKVEKYAELMQSNSSYKYVHRYNIVILNLFDPELQLINTKPMIKNKLKKLLGDLKKFKVLKILVSDYKKKTIVKSSIQVLNLLPVIQTLIKNLYSYIKALWQKWQIMLVKIAKKMEIISTL